MRNTKPSRRGYLSFLADLLIAVIALLVAIPALGYVFAPLCRSSRAKSGETPFSDAGLLADYPAGQWRLATLEVVQEDGWRKTRVRHAVWVRRQEASPVASA